MVDSHTPGVALPSFDVVHMGIAQGQCPTCRLWGAGIWHVKSERAHECPIKNDTVTLILRLILRDAKNGR